MRLQIIKMNQRLALKNQKLEKILNPKTTTTTTSKVKPFHAEFLKKDIFNLGKETGHNIKTLIETLSAKNSRPGSMSTVSGNRTAKPAH